MDNKPQTHLHAYYAGIHTKSIDFHGQKLTQPYSAKNSPKKKKR